jgi:hypothetical protein
MPRDAVLRADWLVRLLARAWLALSWHEWRRRRLRQRLDRWVEK